MNRAHQLIEAGIGEGFAAEYRPGMDPVGFRRRENANRKLLSQLMIEIAQALKFDLTNVGFDVGLAEMGWEYCRGQTLALPYHATYFDFAANGGATPLAIYLCQVHGQSEVWAIHAFPQANGLGWIDLGMIGVRSRDGLDIQPMFLEEEFVNFQ
ncbi:MAG: hypothetical protein QOK29_2460, partial [Rhodospirillaceae bacterium]|nr:hypothetical protein [Rhodospirillaceae bacterium]